MLLENRFECRGRAFAVLHGDLAVAAKQVLLQLQVRRSGFGFTREAGRGNLLRGVRELKVLKCFVFRGNIDARNQTREIKRHRGFGFFEHDELLVKRTDQNKSGAVIILKGTFHLRGGKLFEAHFRGTHQAFIKETGKIIVVSGGKLRRAVGNFQQFAARGNDLLIFEYHRIEQEVQKTVAKAVERQIRSWSNNHVIAIADVAKIDAIADERLDEHSKSAHWLWFHQFAEIGRSAENDLAQRIRESGDFLIYFGLHGHPFAAKLCLCVKVVKDRAEIVDCGDRRRNIVSRNGERKVWRRADDQSKGKKWRQRFIRADKLMLLVELAHGQRGGPLQLQQFGSQSSVRWIDVQRGRIGVESSGVERAHDCKYLLVGLNTNVLIRALRGCRTQASQSR